MLEIDGEEEGGGEEHAEEDERDEVEDEGGVRHVVEGLCLTP